MRLLVVAATCLAATVIPASPASAAGGTCVVVAPGSPSCTLYTNGTGGYGVCLGTGCVLRAPDNSIALTTGQVFTYQAARGVPITLSVSLGSAAIADNASR